MRTIVRIWTGVKANTLKGLLFQCFAATRARYAKLQAHDLDLTLLLTGILLALAGLLAIPLWTGKLPVHDDLSAFYFPLRYFYANCLIQGDSCHWMPHLYGGFFMTGEGQQGVFHPLHQILYRYVPVRIAFDAELVLPYVLLPIGLALFLRRYTGLAGALAAGLFAAYSQAYLHLIFNPIGTLILAHLPYILVAMRTTLETRRKSTRLLGALSVALLTASQLLLGYPQSVWFCLLSEGVLGIFLYLQYRPSAQTCLLLVGAYPLAAILAAVQLLATFEHLQSSLRAQIDLAYKCSYSQHPASLSGWLAPFLYWDYVSSWTGMYLGSVPLLLSLWWLGSGRGTAPCGDVALDGDADQRTTVLRRLGLAAFCLFVLTTWLSLGSFGFLYYLQTYLPLVGSFRCPSRYTVVAEIAFAIVAGAGLARLSRNSRIGVIASYRTLILPWSAFGASICVAIGFTEQRAGTGSVDHWSLVLGIAATALLSLFVLCRYWPTARLALTGSRLDARLPWLTGAMVLVGGFYLYCVAYKLNGAQIQKLPWSGPILFFVAAAALTLAARGRRLGLLALIAFAAIDLLSINMLNPKYAKPCWRRHMPTLEEFLEERYKPEWNGEGRLFDASWGMNQLAAEGYRLASGYAGLEPRRVLDYENLNSLRVAEVAFFRNWDFHCPSRPVAGLGPRDENEWCRVPDPLPRARLVCHALPSADPRTEIKQICVDTTVLTTHPIDLPESIPGTVEIVRDRPGNIQLQTDAPDTQVLVVSESYHHGWRATLDGAPATVERLYGDFMGCVVSAGPHEVRFEFDPTSLRIGRIVSLIGLGACFLIAALAFKLRRFEKKLARAGG